MRSGTILFASILALAGCSSPEPDSSPINPVPVADATSVLPFPSAPSKSLPSDGSPDMPAPATWTPSGGGAMASLQSAPEPGAEVAPPAPVAPQRPDAPSVPEVAPAPPGM
jgi:hypothetical protein